MSKSKYRVIGILGAFISIILISLYSNIILILTSFIEEHISHDHHIEPEGIDNIKKLLSTIIALLIVISSFLIFNGFEKIVELIKTFINLKKVKETFLTNHLTTKIKIQPRLFIVGTLFALLLPFLLPIFNEPKSEGFIEESSSMFYLVAALVLIISSTQIRGSQFTPNRRKHIKIILITISVIFLVMFGEEISWGQRIFEWEATGIFKEYNTQKETNIHNFFNPLFDMLYRILGLCLFICLFFLWFFPKADRTYLSRLFIPHVSSFFLIFIMACLNFNGHSEIFEELLAIFCLLYSIRIYYSLKFPKAIT